MTQAGTPKIRTCGTMGVHFSLLEQYPSFRANLASLEHKTEMRRTMDIFAVPWTTVTIPVVVHVVYKNDKDNISSQQVQSQIDVLNHDFRAKNQDIANTPAAWRGIAADAGIEFVLASKDPAGAATNGITRTKTDLAAFNDFGNPVKFTSKGGVDAWPADKYMNIWVCKLEDGLLGYAQFPGGPSATDGVVILNTAFGSEGIASPPYHLGRTATHEIGHWFNLYHIWADTPGCDGTDFVEDTPNQAGPNYGSSPEEGQYICPTFPHITCNNGPYGDMWMNYMDYVYDKCMYMFTMGQVLRMHTALQELRSSFLPK